MITAIDSGNTAWVLLSAALAFLMIPGFALCYGGFSRGKEGFPDLSKSLMLVCLIMLQWAAVGYSLAFGPDHGGWIGTLAHAGLAGVGVDPNLEHSASIPHVAFMLYQGALALLPPLLILNACAERIKFSACCFFLVLWTTFVYDPVVHWVWGVGGFLRLSGLIDFAGGIPVQLSAGATALVIGLSLGRRRGTSSPSTPLAAWGAFLLWFAWPGVNAGSALSSGGLAANAVLTTNATTAAAALVWGVLDGIFRKRPSPLGILAGLITGLAAGSASAGYLTVGGAVFAGIGASIVSYGSLVYMKKKWGTDAAFDIFAIHGIGGIWGLAAAGLLSDHPTLVAVQMKAVLATVIYTFMVSAVLLVVVDRLVGLRATAGEPL